MQASALEEAASRKSQREVYRKVQTLTVKITRNISVVKDKDGKALLQGKETGKMGRILQRAPKCRNHLLVL